MAFNTTSFLAGVGTVVVVLSTGFAGGYMVANPNAPAPPNRLQRLAANNEGAKTAAPAPVTAAKPDVVADATAAPPVAPAPQPTAAPSDAKPQIQAATAEAKADTTPTTATTPAATAAEANTPPAQPVSSDRTGGSRAQAVDARTQDIKSTENRAAEKKRADTRKYAEQQRKQRELEVATVAVRRIIHERPPQEVVVDDDQPEAPAAPHFSLFGQE